MILRLCYSRLNKLNFNEETNKFEGFGLKGPLNRHLDYLKQININFTAFGDASLGYDGCAGRLQSNKSDVILPELVVPLLGPGIIQGPTCFVDQESILSVYNTTTESIATQTTDVFVSNFTPLVWFITFESLLIMFILILFTLLAESWIKGQKRNRLGWNFLHGTISWRLVQRTALLVLNVLRKDPHFQPASRSMRHRFLVSLLIFMNLELMLHFEYKISTDQVLPLKPHTIESYDDIIDDPAVRPVWFLAINSHHWFSDAPIGSKRKQVWNKALSMDIEKSMLRGTQPPFKGMNNGSHVLIGRKLFMKAIAAFLCESTKVTEIFPPELDPLTRVDSSETAEQLLVLFLSSHTPMNLRSKIMILYRRILEASLSSQHIRNAHNRGISYGMKDVSRCLSNRVSFAEKRVDRLTFSKIVSFFLASYCLCMIALLIFCLEILFAKV